MRLAVNELGQTIVMVTHESEMASYASRVLNFRDGQLAAVREGLPA
jgi:putative ABC transport system ATP-binding protein